MNQDLEIKRKIENLQDHKAWNPLPQKDWGDNFIGPWGTLNFHLPLGGLVGGAGFYLLGGMGGVLPPLAKNYSSLPDQEKSLPVDSSHQRIIPPTK